jgi:hypothetical protein
VFVEAVADMDLEAVWYISGNDFVLLLRVNLCGSIYYHCGGIGLDGVICMVK